jgi:hypothetical protein
MRTIALDSQIIIWGVRGVATPGQEQMIYRAQRFLKYLAESRDVVVIVPAPVVAEILVRVPEAQHPPILEKINTTMQVPPFDIMAASVYAGLYAACRDPITVKPVPTAKPSPTPPPATPGRRDELKADLMILAVAVVRNVSVFYSQDEPMTKLCRERLAGKLAGKLRLEAMPAIPGGQLPLPGTEPPIKQQN